MCIHICCDYILLFTQMDQTQYSSLNAYTGARRVFLESPYEENREGDICFETKEKQSWFEFTFLCIQKIP